MRVSGIIHQQICQIKWHLLACLGLIMVLPVEEAVVNLRAGDGFFSDGMTLVAIIFGPLLAGLIACANVQGDLNEKRYIFWRSKPANVKFLITLKFIIGLVASLLIIACPVVFHFVSNIIWNEEGIDKWFFKFYVPLPILIAIMTYSLCFACNVLVRKTARAWLIGMLTGCFLLVLPFMLPLDFKDFVSDVMIWSWGPYLAIMLITPAAAFVFALYAAKHDWHLKTNLKSLLWAGAGLVFILMMLFSSQVANIKVLQEKEIEFDFGQGSLNYAGSRVVYQGDSYIDDDKDGFSLQKIGSGNVRAYPYSNIGTDSAGHRIHYGPSVAGYSEEIYPRHGNRLYKDAGNEIFFFSIHAYYRSEGQPPLHKRFYEKVYLRSYKHTGNNWMPVCELDISDCFTNKISPYFRAAMRLIDNRLIACVNNSYVLVDVTNPGELKLIDKKLDVLQRFRPSKDRKKEFSIPLVPIEEFGLEERIRLSIDLNYNFNYGDNEFYDSSIVDIHDDKLAFFFIDFLDYDDVARFDVIRWDDEKIYCKYSNSRPFTILESVTGAPGRFSPKFVKNGKLYCHNSNTLMVFDIRSNRRIRKLGHFVRMDYDIQDMAVLEDGNILLCVRWDPEFIRDRSNEDKYYLYLLKNPE
ncbi:MAG: hypothetical protein H8D56_14840 [Planctomycetes bacterium]|nr:hypothetical protein [Planctomycetota bacterium]MBL7144825.1 hypothetical protein [Phycisphaerae bacterium]